jgi:multiple sugar transport system substrate-binding protein
MRPLYFGAKIYSDDTWSNGGNPSEVYFNSQEVINVYQKLSDLIFKDKISPTDSIVQGLGGQSGESFTSGKIAMKPAGAWILSGTNELPFKVGVAAIPNAGNDKIRDTLYVDPLFILKGSKNPKAAYEWIKFNLEPDIQEKMIELSGGNPPSNMKAFEKYCSFFPNIDPGDLKKVYEGGIKYGTESYNHLINNYSQIWTIVKNETDPCLLTGKSTAADVAPEVQEKVTKLIKEMSSK